MACIGLWSKIALTSVDWATSVLTVFPTADQGRLFLKHVNGTCLCDYSVSVSTCMPVECLKDLTDPFESKKIRETS